MTALQADRDRRRKKARLIGIAFRQATPRDIWSNGQGIMIGESLLRVLLAISIAQTLLAGCADGRMDPSSSEAISAGSWQYPIRLGDPRARVHELLGAATRTTAALEEYPASGVTAWFDSKGRVTKLNFAGGASAVYSTASFEPIISNHPVLFGLTGLTDEAGFRRVLGVPAKESQERRTSVTELRCVWKKDGYVVALFLVAERSYEGHTYSKGSLLWFEVSRGL